MNTIRWIIFIPMAMFFFSLPKALLNYFVNTSSNFNSWSNWILISNFLAGVILMMSGCHIAPRVNRNVKIALIVSLLIIIGGQISQSHTESEQLLKMIEGIIATGGALILNLKPFRKIID